MQVKDVMTRTVISVQSDDQVLKAARLMLQNRISGLPVVDKTGELVGIVTEGDFLRRSELGTQRRRSKWLEFIVGPGKLHDPSGPLRRAPRRQQQLDEAEIHLGGGGTIHDDHRMLRQRLGEAGVRRLHATQRQRAIQPDVGRARWWVCHRALRPGCCRAVEPRHRGPTHPELTGRA